MAEANVLNTFQCGFESHRGHMEPTKILGSDFTTTRFEIFQYGHNLWPRCTVCDLWVTAAEFVSGWVEIYGCTCPDRHIHVRNALENAGMFSHTRKYDSSGMYREEFIEFMKAVSASQFSLEDILDDGDIEDTPLLYQWIAFWAGIDVLDLTLNFQES